MAEKLLQGGNIFEITDHTTASDWERFISQLEEILTEWELHKQTNRNQAYQELPAGSISSGIWHEKRDVLKYGNVSFELRYQYLSNVELKRPKAEELAKAAVAPAQRGQDDQTMELQSGDGSPDYQAAQIENEEDSSGDDEDDENSMRSKVPQAMSEEKVEDREHGEHELPENTPECLLDLIATTNDFASKAHCLVRWYNLRKFMILSPRGDTIVSQDRMKLILSSASIALANIDCHVPIFLQIKNPRNNFYQGISEHLNIRTTYEMVFYQNNLKQFGYLSSLISMFREKVGCQLSDPISATIRLNYCLDSFDLFLEPNEEFSGIEYDDDDENQRELMKMTAEKRKLNANKRPNSQDMRSGATYEQVVEALEDCVPHPFKILRFLHVAALWLPVSDKVIVDSQVHTDLDPSEAPVWTIRCVSSDNCNMKLVHETQALYELFTAAINYAYDKLDAQKVFDNCDKETLKSRCLRLSYDLATNPEVILSEKPSDSIRKLVALMFHRRAERIADIDYPTLDQQPDGEVKRKKTPISLNEIYRSFMRKHKPSVKEFIIRTQISRPFTPKSTPALPQRMFCTICDEEFRLCGAFSELCN